MLRTLSDFPVAGLIKEVLSFSIFSSSFILSHILLWSKAFLCFTESTSVNNYVWRLSCFLWERQTSKTRLVPKAVVKLPFLMHTNTAYYHYITNNCQADLSAFRRQHFQLPFFFMLQITKLSMNENCVFNSYISTFFKGRIKSTLKYHIFPNTLELLC